MDYSKYIEMKQKAANTYKSNWQPRDASEVTLRRQAIGNSGNKSTHKGVSDTCLPCNLPVVSSTNVPGKGYNSDYSMDVVSNRKAGCTVLNDTAWGKAGGVNLIGCDQVTKILTAPSPTTSNSVSCYSENPGVVQRGIADPLRATPAFTGWNNHVVSNGNGHIPKQVYPYPSG